jgi:hypothetical protein
VELVKLDLLEKGVGPQGQELGERVVEDEMIEHVRGVGEEAGVPSTQSLQFHVTDGPVSLA